jgi:hypothetical protein
VWLDTKPDEVRNVASVDVGVALPGGLLASSGAIATVAKAQHAGWLVVAMLSEVKVVKVVRSTAAWR